MKPPISLVLICLMSCLTLALATACGQQQIQLPAVEPVEELHQEFEREKSTNPTRLEDMVARNEVRAFSGTIKAIEGAAIQFHIDEKMLERDAFVECAFPSEDDIMSLNIGQKVTVYGKLHEAFSGGLFGATGDSRAVKFKDCAFYPTR